MTIIQVQNNVQRQVIPGDYVNVEDTLGQDKAVGVAREDDPPGQHARVEKVTDDYEADLSETTWPEIYVEEGTFEPNEIAWADFVFYVPIDTVQGYQQTIHHGKDTAISSSNSVCLVLNPW